MKNFWLNLTGIALVFSAAVNLMADNVLKDGSFSAENGWFSGIHAPFQKAGAALEFKNGNAVVNIPEFDQAQPYFIQLRHKLALEAGKSYKIKFKVNSSDCKGTIGFNYHHGNSIYATLYIFVAQGDNIIEKTFSVKADKNGKCEIPAEMVLHCGGFKKNTLTLSEISLEDIATTATPEKK